MFDWALDTSLTRATQKGPEKDINESLSKSYCSSDIALYYLAAI